jgi:Holliday junction resolvase RusA-like endonuclease
MIVTPSKTRQFESVVRERATMEWKGDPLVTCAVCMDVTFVREIPKSWSKKKTAAALAGELRPASKPDLDNLEKAVTDALNQVVYYDDSLIVEKTSRKVYGARPRAEITLTWPAATTVNS